MRTRDILLAALTCLLLISCQAGRQDVQTLSTIQQTKDPRVVAQTPVTCTDVSDVCGRLYEERGAACLQLTESADAGTRATMRRCAMDDFRQALSHLPPSANRLIATRGLAEAVLISRDNTPDAAVRSANATELAALASQLQSMPGGEPYGAYYASNNDLNRVLIRAVPAGQACATLKAAQDRLPGSGAPSDLGARLSDLRRNLAAEMSKRSCS
jgi:hypothetical protein